MHQAPTDSWNHSSIFFFCIEHTLCSHRHHRPPPNAKATLSCSHAKPECSMHPTALHVFHFSASISHHSASNAVSSQLLNVHQQLQQIHCLSLTLPQPTMNECNQRCNLSKPSAWLSQANYLLCLLYFTTSPTQPAQLCSTQVQRSVITGDMSLSTFPICIPGPIRSLYLFTEFIHTNIASLCPWHCATCHAPEHHYHSFLQLSHIQAVA